MSILVNDAQLTTLASYSSIPISFTVESVYDIAISEGAVGLTERRVEPWLKDYDAISGESPALWPLRFDTSQWRMFTVAVDWRLVGGAVVAWDTPGLDMLALRPKSACLWDIRVVPEFRGSGVGRALFAKAANWASRQGAAELVVETQNINVQACKFYASMGCELVAANFEAYAPDLDEVQLIWSKTL